MRHQHLLLIHTVVPCLSDVDEHAHSCYWSACTHSVLAVHDQTSTVYMDLALDFDFGLTVLPIRLAHHHAFPVILLIAMVM